MKYYLIEGFPEGSKKLLRTDVYADGIENIPAALVSKDPGYAGFEVVYVERMGEQFPLRLEARPGVKSMMLKILRGYFGDL